MPSDLLLLYTILKRLSVGVGEIKKKLRKKVSTESSMMGERAVERIDVKSGSEKGGKRPLSPK